jgi:hypothetical protein
MSPFRRDWRHAACFAATSPHKLLCQRRDRQNKRERAPPAAPGDGQAFFRQGELARHDGGRQLFQTGFRVRTAALTVTAQSSWCRMRRGRKCPGCAEASTIEINFRCFLPTACFSSAADLAKHNLFCLKAELPALHPAGPAPSQVSVRSRFRNVHGFFTGAG